MTKVHNLINSCLTSRNTKNVLLFNTGMDVFLSEVLSHYNVYSIKNFNAFTTYDTIIMSQSHMDTHLEKLYKKFLSDIFVVDDVSYAIKQDNFEYWNKIRNMYSLVNNNYNAVFIALNEYEYVNSNYAHNFFIPVEHKSRWEKII